ncbi:MULTISPECIES: MFS transporter [Acidiplasma]|uniref:Major facilitator superfamily (MFS) profile domain-containing protein n=1 Tax=Acidiplasma cupricumulans TaxID=312540 RepID=A0A0Q0RI88_9ARCH|nr:MULTISPECIES: MFS transporter [Acidiplasma]KQB35081.1 hypothetical protein AOG55_07955 [Acidiplasma cupricumulans]
MEKYWRYTLSAFFGVLLFAFDFEMFLASIPGLIALFNFNLNDINIINDTAFIVSAIAAFSFGYLADKYGRRLLFMITVLLYSFGSLITGFSFSVPTFMFSRGLTSVGAGTDEPLGFTLTAETAPHKLRGRQMLITSLGFPVGQTFGAAVVYLFELYNIHLTYVFFIGVLPALFILYFRKSLPETDRFMDLRKAKNDYIQNKKEETTRYSANLREAIKNPFVQMFHRDLRRKSILIAIYAAILSGSATISLVALPIYYVEIKHIAFLDTLSFEFISFGIGIIGYIFAAHLGNKIGRRNVMAVFMFITSISVSGIILSTSYYYVLLFNIVFIFFLLSQWAAWPFYVNDMFPTRVRATASTYGYAFMWIGNIIMPTSLLSLVYIIGWNQSIIYILMIPIIFSIIISSLLNRDIPNRILEKNAV